MIEADISIKQLSGPQQKFLSCALTRRVPGLNICHMMAGRGAGKTFVGCFAIGLSALGENAGLPHLWAAPTVGDIYDTFFPVWESLWPQSLWSYNQQKKIITLINGTQIFLRGRLVTAGNREPFRGPSWHFVVFDEARQDPNAKAWKTLVLGVRGGSKKQKTIITTSTPLLGWYNNMATGGSDPVIRSTSYDNPISDPDAIERASQDLDERLYQQEVEGKTVALSGVPWETVDLERTWPDGNIHPHKYDPSMPLTLAVDIGRQSAWLLIQHVEELDDLGWRTGRIIDVAVAEYTPSGGRGTTDVMADRITRDYKPPDHVISGQDAVYSGDTNTDVTAETVMMRSGGWGCEITPVTGLYARKNIQYNAANRCLLDRTGFRKFCVSEHLECHDRPRTGARGIREVLLQDQWPDPKKPGFFDKDKPTRGGEALEDMRDAFLYAMIILNPIKSHMQIGAVDPGES
jgi:hypothetical protein